ncbi:DNA polymerase III subunit beta [Niveispirillum sp. KHB5.9]|uniref:DNA polymerase III subunit beta n=1 Tax=Niveispirillum sp. KHB5.9 TaxID=3400269 RepID=UPI003A8750BE
MKIIIERAALLRSLGHVQSVVERRNTIPVLSNVLLNAGNGTLSLVATDMDLEISETVTAEILTPGSATAPAHTLYDIARKLPDGSQVELDATGDVLTLRSGRSNFKLGTLPVADFPEMTHGSWPHQFALKADVLKGLIDRTKFAISTEETRYYLNGIHVHATKGKAGEEPSLRAVATDGHRLARVETPLPEGAAGLPGVIIPRKTVLEVRKLLDEVGDMVEIGLSETKIRFSLGDVTLVSKLIDGTFPDYERVIPAGNDKSLDVDSKLFAAAVDRVATISTEKSRAVKLSLGQGVLTLSATAADAGSASEELEVDYASTPLEIGFNSRYLLDITGQIESGKARLQMADGNSPTIVRDAADASALYVLMPMRV